MSSFSDRLKHHIERRKMSTSELSRLSGIEYSFLHRMTTGKRLPAKLQTVDKLCQLLSLTTEERDDLRTQYEIARVGEDIFRRRQSVSHMLEELSFPAADSPSLPAAHRQPLPASCSGRSAVLALVHQIAAREALLPYGRLRLIAQPGQDDAFPTRTLGLITSAVPSLEIQHLLCFDNRAQMEFHNVDTFAPLLPLLFSSGRYHVFYFYSDRESLFGHLALFPNLLLSSQYALLMSPDYTSALCFTYPASSFTLLQRRFEECFQNCYPLSRPDDHLSRLEPYLGACSSSGDDLDLTFFLSHTIFAVPFLTREVCDRLLRPDLSNRTEILRRILDYTHSFRQFHQEAICYLSTLDGLRGFLNTGLLPEFPEHLVRPLPLADRVHLVRRFLDHAAGMQSLNCGLRFYDTDHLLFSPSLKCLCRQNLSQAELILCHPRQGLLSVTVLEPMLSSAISDYFHALLGTRMVLSATESLERAEELLSEYK